jgi:lipid-A-disaccharide synthase
MSDATVISPEALENLLVSSDDSTGDDNKDALKIYIIAGEASGDFIGSHLMRSLKRQIKRPILFFGVGGDRMEEEGMVSLFPYHEISLLGVVELLPHLITIFSRINFTKVDILGKQPDIVITIDSPGFCFRVIEKLRADGGYKGKCIHYVAPTVWAYKPQRAAYCAKLFDHIMVLFSFETPYFEKANLPCTWVGHPVIVENERGSAEAFRKKYEIADSTTVFLLLPGSRKNEIKRLLPVFANAISMLAQSYPDLAIVVAVPKSMMIHVGPYFENCPFRAIITSNDQEKRDAIAASNIAFAKSGTVTLEVAMAGVPMLVAYRIHAISAWWFKRLSLIKYVNLINIIAKREIYPELLQSECTALTVAGVAARILEDKEYQKQQREEAQKILSQMIPPNGEQPSDIAASVVAKALGL